MSYHLLYEDAETGEMGWLDGTGLGRASRRRLEREELVGEDNPWQDEGGESG